MFFEPAVREKRAASPDVDSQRVVFASWQPG
jgi:hypothetical protein